MRPLIEHGYVYIAQPPLFKVSKGKKHFYAFSDEERDEKIAELGAAATFRDIRVSVRWIRSSFGRLQWTRNTGLCSG